MTDPYEFKKKFETISDLYYIKSIFVGHAFDLPDIEDIIGGH